MYRFQLPQYHVITDEQDALELCSRVLHTVPEVAIDTETTGLRFFYDRVTHWSISFADGSEESGANRYAIDTSLIRIFEPVFRSPHITKVFHNALFDLVMLYYSFGIEMEGDIICTQVMDCLVDENRFGNHGLKECAWDYLGLVADDFSTTFQGEDISKIPISDPRMADYASKDTWITLLLKWELESQMRKEVLGRREGRDFTLWDMHQRFYPRLNRTVFHMCRDGWLVDTAFLSKLIPVLEKDIERIDQLFNRAAMDVSIELGMPLWIWEWEVGVKHVRVEKVYPGGYINPGSDKQVRHFLFEVLGYPVLEYTSGGESGDKQPSLSDSVLEELHKSYGCTFAGLIQQRRDIQKTLSTYLRGLSESADTNGYIHASLRIMGARTGRFSCRAPNLQNIRKPQDDPYLLRRAFIASPGYKLLVRDYSTLEMVILANMSKCPDLCNAILSGLDLHCWTASTMFDIPYDDLVWAKKNEHNLDLSLEEREKVRTLLQKRSAAKAIGFGIIYGMGPKKLSEQLNLIEELTKQYGYPVSEREAMLVASEYIQKYLDTYPGVRRYMDDVLSSCRRNEFVQTWLKRKRRLPSINSLDGAARTQSERQALNSIIQGTASDIVMIAMLQCAEDERLKALGCKMLMQVHDELIFECPEEHAEEAMEIIRQNMEDPFATSFMVPITSSGGIADNWAAAK